jgi:hypothetical protein
MPISDYIAILKSWGLVVHRVPASFPEPDITVVTWKQVSVKLLFEELYQCKSERDLKILIRHKFQVENERISREDISKDIIFTDNDVSV